MAAVEGTPDPRVSKVVKLSFESDGIRRAIIASYWLVVFLALPLWWNTTSIERLSLPTSRVLAQTDNELRFPVRVQLDTASLNIDETVLAATLQDILADRASAAPLRWKGLDIEVVPKQRSGSPEIRESAGTYTVQLGGDRPRLEKRTLYFPWTKEYSLLRLADVLSILIAPSTSDHQSREHRAVQYAPQYRLAFSLLNEDAADGPAAVGWDIQSAIHRHISPLLGSLSALHNFTLESQIQFHAPLAFSPAWLPDDNSYGLTPEDLTIFVNSAQWTLSSSSSNDPVLHFILFIPTASRRPLNILDAQGMPLLSSAFLLPQWGGISIYNPPAEATTHLELSTSQLDEPFSAFSTQLLALLGVPRLPTGIPSTDRSPLTPWQIDALLRKRAIENTEESQETLQSIVKLVQQIGNMPVGQYVKGDVQDALSALEKLYTVATSSPALALRYSSQALSLTSRAFFNPGMLALLYFPAEHKYAVYTPLFASAFVPLAAAAAREIIAWRRERRLSKREKID
ncbi:hypothetical protein PLICRDRAFT_46135 [Plicaturopsis crispa FD-325 SS-3]|uniref:GPI transamidase component PIG-S n=1 Tax=Plicaturopsis crispa FD-325 SS-3 TaxID=944288 RepID=A0A0C9SKT2_PLICR|nr:hypothetical protein PLICRDRAFT_46135 [Plicaturopsis crispa FD-325 SS-3]